MAGTLVIGTISDGTNSANVSDFLTSISGAAKATVTFNGTGTIGANQTIYRSFNVSSVYKNGGADWTINYTNAIASYHTFVATSRIGGGENGAGSGGAICQISGLNGSSNTLTAYSSRFGAYNTLVGASAGDIICAVAF